MFRKNVPLLCYTISRSLHRQTNQSILNSSTSAKIFCCKNVPPNKTALNGLKNYSSSSKSSDSDETTESDKLQAGIGKYKVFSDYDSRKMISLEGDRSHDEKAESSSTKETTAHDNSQKRILMDTSEQDFAKIRNLPAYVDKSMLIKKVIDGESRILLIAPRRFGKSVNLDMMKRFFEIFEDPEAMANNRKLFEGLEIEKHTSIMDQYCGKHPVILLDFKGSAEIDSYDCAFKFVRGIVHEAFQQHPYLASSNKLTDSQRQCFNRWYDDNEFKTIPKEQWEIEDGLQSLAKFLVKHFDKEIIFLVDEYDSICCRTVFCARALVDSKTGNVLMTRDETIKKVIASCMGAIGCLAKGNTNVNRVILTGISYLMTQGLSGINNVEKFKFQENHPYARFYGLETGEVKELLKICNLDSKFNDVQQYYNGYHNDRFNTLSIMKYLNTSCYLEEPKLGNYWTESGIVCNLNDTLRITIVRSIINNLLGSLSNGYEIFNLKSINYEDIVDLKNILSSEDLHIENVDVFLNFLLEQGYFKVINSNLSTGKITIKIPNLEIKQEFKEKLFLYYTNAKLDMSLVKYCASILDQLRTSDEENEKLLVEFNETLNTLINGFPFEVKNEATLHHLIFIIVFCTENFRCFSEVRSAEKKLKRLDLLLLSSVLGIIIELKYNKKAEEGLNQIIENKYYEAFNHSQYNPDEINVQYCLLMGLNMSYEQKMTLSVLFNCYNFEKKVSFD